MDHTPGQTHAQGAPVPAPLAGLSRDLRKANGRHAQGAPGTRLGVRRLEHDPLDHDSSEPVLASVLSFGEEIRRLIQVAVTATEERLSTTLDQCVEEAVAAATIEESWPEWMTPATACRYIDGVSNETLRRWVREHLADIRRRRGSAVWYRRADIDDLMEARFPLPTPPPP